MVKYGQVALCCGTPARDPDRIWIYTNPGCVRSHSSHCSAGPPLHSSHPTCRLDESTFFAGDQLTSEEGSFMQRIWIGILLALSFLPAAWPQASSATVRGTVRD